MVFFHRNITTEETQAIADFLDGLFSCDLHVMYPEAFNHIFMSTSPSTESVKQCVVFNKDEPGCNTEIPVACRSTNLDERLANKCHVKVDLAHQCYKGMNTSDCDDPDLMPYISRLKCYTSFGKSSKCLRDFEKQCNMKRLSVTKVHRLSMQSVESIIEKIPDIYIVYYVRDPRGILMSRGTFGSRVLEHSFLTNALCKQMEKDYHMYTKLKSKFPSSLHMLRYEDLVMNLKDELRNLFHFIDEPITHEILSYMASITNATSDSDWQGVRRRDGVKTSMAWRDKISTDANKISKKKCAGIIKLLGYDM